MIDIKQLELLYFQSNKPVKYKLKCGVEIQINPILVEDWGIFENCLDIIKIYKNEINDFEIVKMNYLDFLIYNIQKEKELYKNSKTEIKLATLLYYSLGEELISIENDSNGKNNLAILNKDSTIKYFINHKEFDDIKSIILHQNIYDYDDRYIDPEIRMAIEAYNKTKARNQSSPTFEKQKVFVISKTGISMDKLNSMTYRTFSQLYSLNIKEDLYLSRTIIKSSQKYEIKEDIIHPLFEKDKDILDEIFIDAESFVQKIETSI